MSVVRCAKCDSPEVYGCADDKCPELAFMPTIPTLGDCTCDAFALTAERHRASCPIGASWVLRSHMEAER